MRRRALLATIGTAGVAGFAGCSVGTTRTLSNPTVDHDSAGRGSLVFTSDGEDVGTFGVNGFAGSEVIELDVNIWHREDTLVESIRLRTWTEPRDSHSDVALVSPVTGDSSPPPSVTLSYPDRGYGTVIEVNDLDDLADETISTIDLLVRPRSNSPTTVVIDSTIELTSTDLGGDDYTLEGVLELDYPALGEG